MAAITVVGSLNMDLVIRAPRHPHQGETLLGGAFGMTGGGKGANQALAAARLRAESSIIGCVGNDDFGKRLRQSLLESHVNCDHLKSRAEAWSGVAVITVTDEGRSTIVLSQGANALLETEALEEARDLFKRSDAVLFQLEIPPETVAGGLQLARRMGCRTFLSADPPSPLPSEVWSWVDCLVLNQTALTFYSSVPGRAEGPLPEEELEPRVREIQSRGVRNVVVTHSDLGGRVFPHGKPSFAYAPFRVSSVDTTGARDAFCAGLCVGMCEGMSLEEASRFASAAGALACTRMGACPSMPWRHEVEALMRGEDKEEA